MVGGNNMSSSCYQQQQIEEHVGSTSSLNTQSSGLFGTAGLKIPELVKKLGPLLTCPICLDILRNTTVTECLHRFCSECIKNSIYKSNRQCPICRRKIVSKRNLRPDPNIDSLIDTIWPNRYVHERVIMDSNYKTPIKFDPDSSNNNATIGDFSSSEDDFSSDNSKDNDFSSSSDDL